MNRRNRKKRFTGQVSLMEEVKPKNIFETPQGDERLGWTGDAEIFCRTACFLENTYSSIRETCPVNRFFRFLLFILYDFFPQPLHDPLFQAGNVGL